MASLFKPQGETSQYRDRRFKGTQAEFEHALRTSTTVYVGNLSFYTTEEQIYEMFAKTGELRRIVMGLDKNTMTPCGFCFVMYYTRADTEDSVKYISGTILDDRPVRVDFDWGFMDGRQWGRGRSGGQVRDEYRTDYDPGRGGYGKLVQKELEVRRLADYSSPEMLMAPPGHFGVPFPVTFPQRRFDRAGGAGQRGGHQGGGNRKRPREEGAVPTTKPPPETERRPQETNPRFRERRQEEDDDDDMKPAT